jgi:hypothetical protein
MVGFWHPLHTIGETFFQVLAETKVKGYLLRPVELEKPRQMVELVSVFRWIRPPR